MKILRQLSGDFSTIDRSASADFSFINMHPELHIDEGENLNAIKSKRRIVLAHIEAGGNIGWRQAKASEISAWKSSDNGRRSSSTNVIYYMSYGEG
ncbi:MAG: hypothetical protein GF364_06950 [Candidatus Lokiarchaeota archaeon]|nr:hypothetical protein [Candidatus Lokiarchaeota archaeon]